MPAPLSQREPVVLAQLIQTLLLAIIGLLVAAEVVTITPAVTAALLGVYVAGASVITYVLRGRVYSPATVAELAAPPPPEFP